MKKTIALKHASKANDQLILQSFAAIDEAVDQFWIEAACLEEMARTLAEDQTVAGYLANPDPHVPTQPS